MQVIITVLLTTLCCLAAAALALAWLYRRVQAAHFAQVARLRADNERLLGERATLLTQGRGLLAERHADTLPPAPSFVRRIYNIVTVGTSACGKTALTFKWAQPTFKLQELVATTFQRFERTVSRQWQQERNAMVEHVFEILDWGGEHIGDAQTSLLKVDEINAMIMVVDVGIYDPRTGGQVPSRERVRYQLEQFNPYVLPLFFSQDIVEHCKTFVLFINKADLLSGTWREVEEQVMAMYAPLIQELKKHQERKGISFRVMVGSAEAGHGTHELFGHLIERILPPEAYDAQLRATLHHETQVSAAAADTLVGQVLQGA